MKGTHMGILQTYIQFWIRFFDFKGTSSRRQFWIPMLINYTGPIILAIIWYCLRPFPLNWKMNLISITNTTLLSNPLSSFANNSTSSMVIISILLILLGLLTIATVAITIRRIRDTGFNPIIVIIIYIALLFFNIILGLIFIPIVLLVPTSASNPKASKFYNYNNYDDDEWSDQ